MPAGSGIAMTASGSPTFSMIAVWSTRTQRKNPENCSKRTANTVSAETDRPAASSCILQRTRGSRIHEAQDQELHACERTEASQCVRKASKVNSAAEVRRRGGLAPKFVSPGLDGVPDRLILLPGGKGGFRRTESTRQDAPSSAGCAKAAAGVAGVPGIRHRQHRTDWRCTE